MTIETEIAERLAQTTPGPWSVETMRPHTIGIAYVNAPTVQKIADCSDPVGLSETHGWCLRIEAEQGEANADFIAHAPEDIAVLLAHVKELKAVMQESERALLDLGEHRRECRGRGASCDCGYQKVLARIDAALGEGKS